jgi:hypothetical protein
VNEQPIQLHFRTDVRISTSHLFRSQASVTVLQANRGHRALIVVRIGAPNRAKRQFTPRTLPAPTGIDQVDDVAHRHVGDRALVTSRH